MKTSIQEIYKIVGLMSLLFACAPTLIAQIDIPSASIEIGIEAENDVPEEIFISPIAAPEDRSKINSGSLSIKSKMKLGDPFAGEKKREVQFVQAPGDWVTRDFSKLEKKMNKTFNTKKDVQLKPEFYKDQNLGNFKSGSKFVNFTYRDHQYVDGDRVSVSINDTIVHPNIWLSGEFQGFYLDLKKGFNKIDIKALNQGTSGPNTAQFVMYDDQKQVISSNIWNLATGVVASIIIVKDN